MNSLLVKGKKMLAILSAISLLFGFCSLYGVSASGTNLQTDKDTYAVSDPIMVTVNGENYASDAWVGIYEKDTVPGTYNSMAFVWYYLTDSGIGTTVNAFDLNKSNTNMKSLPEGEYIIYLFQDGGYNFVEQKELLVKNPVLPALESPSAVTYERTTEEAGKANGKLVITAGEGDLPKGYTAYWADANGKLEGYSSFAAVACSNAAVTEYQIPENTLIPNGADRIIVYAANGNTESNGFVSCMLPEKAADYDFGTPLYEIQVFSDVHLTNNADHLHNQHFAKVLEDVKKMSPNSAGIFINGDIADNGNEDEWQIFEKMIQDAGDGIPEVYCAVGNHELYWGRGMEVGLQNFLKYSRPCEDKPYGDIWIEGTHFIFLGSESQGMTAELSKTQLDWFYQKLAENRDVNRPIYVFLHEGLQNTVAGTFDGQDFGGGYCANGVNQAEQFSAILKEYPEVILFSGHSHWEMESANNMKVRDKNLPTIFNTAAVGYLWNDSAVNIEGAQGYFIKAYKDKVVVCGRDFLRDKWIASAQYIVDYPAKTDESDETYVDFDGESAKYYADNSYDAEDTYRYRAYYNVEIVDTGDGHGKAAKFTEMSASSKISPTVIRLSAADGSGAVHVKKGEAYQMSLDYKLVKADDKLVIALEFIPEYISANEQTSLNKFAAANPGYNQWDYFEIDNLSDGNWRSALSKVFTAPCDGTVLLVPFNDSKAEVTNWWAEGYYGSGAGKALPNQEYYLDNIRLSRLPKVILHNGATGDETVSVAPDTDLSEIKITAPAGAKFKQWYADAALTQPVSGKVGNADRDLYAAFEPVTGDFDSGILAKDGWDGSDFEIIENAGYLNSKALTNKNNEHNLDNTTWPPIIKLSNADGSDFTTIPGHTYRLTFKMQLENRAKLKEVSWVGVTKRQDAPNRTMDTYSDLNGQATQNFLPTAFESDSKYYRTFDFTFTGTGDKVYIAAWNAGTQVYYDDIQIADITAQKTVTDTAGNVLASGYAGETVTIPNSADADFVWYARENDLDTPVQEIVITGDTTLVSVTAQLAVTETFGNAADNTLSFKARFANVEYTDNGDGTVTLNHMIAGNTRYVADEIGLLAVPDEKLNGAALTLENYEALGAIKIANPVFKYSDKADGVLTATAEIKTGDINRDYTVVGYIKYAGHVIYSKTRVGLKRNLTEAAGLEKTDGLSLTHGAYSLVSNSEFDSDDSINSKWNPWGQIAATDDGVKKYSTKDAAYAENGNMVLKTTVTGSDSMNFADMLSSYHFTHGYLEVRAKFSAETNSSGAIWLNSVAIPAGEMTYQPTDDDPAVYPELDIIEFNGNNTQTFATLHSWGMLPDGNGGTAFGQRHQIRLNDPDGNSEHSLNLADWHTYGFERTSEVMRIWIDGVQVYEYTLAQANIDCAEGAWARTENEIKALFDNPTYLIIGSSLNSCDGVQETETLVDYVRFYA